MLTHLCFPPSSPEPPFQKSKKWQTAGGMGAGLPWRGAARGGAAPILVLGDPPLSPLKASPHRKLDLPPPTSVAPSQPQKAPGNKARVPDPGSPSLLQNVCRAAASGPALGAGTSLRGGGNPVPAEVTVTGQQGGACGLPAVRLSLSWPHAVLCSQAPAPQLPQGHRASRDQCTQCPPVSGISHSGPAAGGEPRACTMNPARPPWA